MVTSESVSNSVSASVPCTSKVVVSVGSNTAPSGSTGDGWTPCKVTIVLFSASSTSAPSHCRPCTDRMSRTSVATLLPDYAGLLGDGLVWTVASIVPSSTTSKCLAQNSLGIRLNGDRQLTRLANQWDYSLQLPGLCSLLSIHKMGFALSLIFCFPCSLVCLLIPAYVFMLRNSTVDYYDVTSASFLQNSHKSCLLWEHYSIC